MVFDAAKAVISSKYPMSQCSERKGFLVALTPTELEGATRTRKQISVLIWRNFTGAYEPVVKVRQYVQMESPYTKADPGSGNAALAKPLGRTEWQFLDDRPYEEQEIYEAILKAVEGPPPGDRA